jgi:cytochrome P450 family 110
MGILLNWLLSPVQLLTRALRKKIHETLQSYTVSAFHVTSAYYDLIYLQTMISYNIQRNEEKMIREKTLPPSPPFPAGVTQLMQVAYPLPWLDYCARHYGTPFTLGGRTHPQVFFSHPQHLRAILTTDRAFFSVKESSTLRPLVGKYSLFALEGEQHKQLRYLLLPPLHGKNLQQYAETVTVITMQIISQKEPNEPFPLRSTMRDITLQFILRIIFGVSPEQSLEPLQQHFILALEHMLNSPANLLLFRSVPWNLGPYSPRGRFLRDLQPLDDWLYTEIRQRRKRDHSSNTDLLTLLIRFVDAGGVPLTDKEIRDEVVTLLFAGHETTASALAWALYWVDRLPAVKERLLTELETLPQQAEVHDILALAYLDAVCKETLRIYPPAPLATRRVVRAPLELANYSFEPGVVLVPCIYLTHQREDLYPSPKQFRPERFLEREFTPYEYLPFGAGTRRCLGDALAPFEMKLVLATILRRSQVKLLYRPFIRPISHGPALSPPAHMQMVITSLR